METSTPLNSPKRKKHSLVQNFIPIVESFGDLETEIQTRRQEAINKSTETRRRLSAAPLLAGYTATQLAQHCKDVIKLSTENKINTKNAFNFWLIDVMAAMAKKNDSEINKNFQVASCTLDASVKIYGYRVDAIHTDAVKMAGGFLSKEVETANDLEEEGNHEGKDCDNPVKPKVKKKKRKVTVVPPETLNLKSELEVLLDVVPRQNFFSRKTSSDDLLIKIPKYNDGGLLVLDPDYPCWPYDVNETLVPKFDNKEIFDSTFLSSVFRDIQISADNDLCPGYTNFEFGKNHERNSDSEDELHTSQNSGRFEFDMQADITEMDIEECGPEAQRNRIVIPEGGFHSDEEIVVRPEKQKQFQQVAIGDMKTRITINPLEYSMFDEKMFKAWAGPAHWKVRPARKPLEEFTNNEEIAKPIASKRTRKGKLKTPAGLFDIHEEILVKNMAENEKTTLFKSTMLNWNSQNTTMPEDLKCKANNIFYLYLLPSFSVFHKYQENDLEETSDHPEDKDEEVCTQEEEELEYCSASIHHNNIDEHNEVAIDEAWDIGNLVEAPNRVEKNPVSSLKRMKHVDIRHLKKGLWHVLTGKSENEAVVTKSIEFGELVKTCPSTLPRSFRSLVSAPLIFNALLHLTNEKSLVLTLDKNNRMNFVISQ